MRVSPWFGAVGAWLAGASVALAAYASHGVEGEARERLMLAAVFAFGHGLAAAAIAPQASRRAARFSLALLLIGVALFSGSLVAAQFFGTPTRFAPLGGTLLMLGWLVLGIDRVRR
ncbi:DUF423 domain-containing protein [Cognatilysobacter bugurensis]|uniref:DUF423 domain-containing protein n=1 Tax=Cognatilysobacter bugurensis TaxID=543356 RepID=A0A918SSZ1_9GAMM|nr:DUF423 domain-containing protein [Lysobacter bugurensis]GHA69254.1 hypothetical protein GCM10007067_01470 [Lysobacter bugurensis]